VCAREGCRCSDSLAGDELLSDDDDEDLSNFVFPVKSGDRPTLANRQAPLAVAPLPSRTPSRLAAGTAARGDVLALTTHSSHQRPAARRRGAQRTMSGAHGIVPTVGRPTYAAVDRHSSHTPQTPSARGRKEAALARIIANGFGAAGAPCRDSVRGCTLGHVRGRSALLCAR
jgi:hypothetical protein